MYKVRRRGERHALKHILLGSQYEEEDGGEVESLRQQTVMEVEILKQLKGHPNVVRLNERQVTGDGDSLTLQWSHRSDSTEQNGTTALTAAAFSWNTA